MSYRGPVWPLFPAAGVLLCFFAIGCSHSRQDAGSLKHYRLTGQVIAIDKPNKSLTVDGDEIPGFMSAMQMPYDVKDPSLMNELAPGDRISADVVVHDDESWLENIRITSPASPAPQPGSSSK